jgi:hypothetical protein
MKKVLALVLGLVLMASVAFTQPLRNLSFEWEQTISEDFGGWYLYMTETPGTGYVRVLDVPYTDQTGPMYTEDFIVEGTAGQVRQFYFSPFQLIIKIIKS